MSEPGIYLASICETPRVDGAAVETRRSFQSEDRFPSAILPAATASIRAMDGIMLGLIHTEACSE